MSLKILQNNKGYTAISTIFILFVCIIITIYIFCYLFNIINVFMCYQKLNSISLKYLFVMERYGYLTIEEENSLKVDLEKNGFKLDLVTINIPNIKETFGLPSKFSLEYKVPLNIPLLYNNTKKEKQYLKVKIEKIFIYKG